MEQRYTLLTLGVTDLERSIAFYEALDWRRSMRATKGVAFFQCGGVALCLYPRENLAREAGVSDEGSGFRAFAIAYNTRSREEVDQVLAEAEAAGGKIVHPAEEAFWGGYTGYFADPDGHLWEVAWNPGFPLDVEGNVTLPA